MIPQGRLCLKLIRRGAAAASAITTLLVLSTALADDTGGLKTPSGRRKVELFPPAGKPSSRPSDRPIELGDWAYLAMKSSQPRDGVPWELVVTPAGPNAKTWRKGEAAWQCLPLPASTRVEHLGDRLRVDKDEDAIPVVEMPEAVWKGWMAGDLQSVVGIHFHEFVTDDVARILYTIHKTPPDEPDGRPPPPAKYKGRAGVRIEATLLTPVTFSLDQTVVIRVDPLEKQLTPGRAQHELGHALATQQILLNVIRGPQDWNLDRCTGRRSRLEFYWKREIIGRSWKGYRDGIGKIATLRTSVVLVPPTRWSLLLPIPPERVTQRHLDDFNEAIVHISGVFAAVDRIAQDRFHAQHGAYE